MSNVVDIDVIEYNVVGETQKEFGIIFSDNYATVIRRCYPSLEKIVEEFPTMQSLVDYLSELPEFLGSDYVLSENYEDTLELTAMLVTMVNVNGYPE